MRETTKDNIKGAGQIISAAGIVLAVTAVAAGFLLGPVGGVIAIGGLVIGGGLMATGFAWTAAAMARDVSKVAKEGLLRTTPPDTKPTTTKDNNLGAWNILNHEEEKQPAKTMKEDHNEASILRRLGVMSQEKNTTAPKKSLLRRLFSSKKNEQPSPSSELNPLTKKASSTVEDKRKSDDDKPSFHHR